jgi:hypothetical protein
MAYGIARFANQAGVLFNQASPSIWADCNSYQLNDESNGYFIQTHFTDNVTLPGLPNTFTPSAGAGFTYNSTFDHVAVATAGTLTNAFIQAYTRPLGPIAAGSGKKLWAEVALSVADVTNVKGIFFGVGNTAAIVPAATTGGDGLVSAVSATRANNALGPAAKSSFAGFWLHGDALTNFDAVYLNQGTAVAPQVATTGTTVGQLSGTLNTVLTSVLTSNATTPNPGNQNYVPANPPGTLTTTGTGGQAQINTGSAGFVQLGVRYDGQTYFYWYVNGIQVAKYAVDSSWDQTSDYGAVLSIATAATGFATNVDFFRAAALLDP